MGEKDENNLSALDAYINRVFKIIVFIIPFFCLCASSSATTLYLLGYFPIRLPRLLPFFDASTILYFLIGLYFMKTGFGKDGIVLPRKLRAAKYAMATLLIIQWNGISYIWPFQDFWGYTVLFTTVLAFFFDFRLVLFETIGILVSMFISWIIVGDALLPPHDELFVANMAYRFIGIALMNFSVCVITAFGGKFLIEELEKYANYDTLTHLMNRKSMGNYLQEAHRLASTGKASFCLLMMDIDDFKKVNDTHGHDAGDEVLQFVAKTVSCGVKKDDYVFRWGGEEILVLLNTDEERAITAAERIRADIAKDAVVYGEAKIPVTITIGVAPYRNGASIKDLMDEADAKLYWGKKHGKNQVVSKLEAK
ncbi:MAG: GGDEF domain-containing protein [Treponema sp.]|nr:GGDEF domain-containing protein [Treponema sp.]